MSAGSSKSVSWFSKAMFLHLSPIYAESNKRTFEQDMHQPLEDVNTSQSTFSGLDSEWKARYSRNHNPNKNEHIFLKTLLAANKGPLIGCFLTGIFLSLCEFGKTGVMYYSLKNFKHKSEIDTSDQFYNNLIILIGGLAFSQLFYSIIYCYLNYYIEVLAQRFTSSVRCLVFSKILKMSFERESVLSMGEIINIVNSDVSNLEEVSNLAWDLFAIPLDLAVGVAGLYYIVGYALFPALGVLAAVMLVNYFFSKLYSRIKKGYNEKKDTRTNSVAELFENIRMVKLNALETLFVQKIIAEKDEEISYIRKLMLRLVFSSVLNEAGSALFLISLNAFCLWMTGSLSLEKAFTSVLILNIFKKKFKDLPDNLSYLVDVLVSSKRLSFLLFCEEVVTSHSCVQEDVRKGGEKNEGEDAVNPEEMAYSVDIRDGQFYWIDQEKLKNALTTKKKSFKKTEKKKDKDKGSSKSGKAAKEDKSSRKSTKVHGLDSKDSSVLNASLLDESTTSESDEPRSEMILKDINLQLRPGTCTAIIGPVGSGKSSLLSAILGEMHKTSDSQVRLSGHVAYTTQTAWLLSSSIRDNILLGRDVTTDFLNEVVKSVCLDEDLAAYNRGLETEVGSKGVGLSGGQKARVALARALCTTTADIFLLDDPISALDVKIGKRVMEQAVLGLLKGKTVVMATHALDFLPYFDQIIVMDAGEIILRGTYSELSNDPAFQKAYKDILSRPSNTANHSQAPSLPGIPSPLLLNTETPTTMIPAPPTPSPSSPSADEPQAPNTLSEPSSADKAVETAVEIEDKARGSIGSELVAAYCKLLGKGKLVVIGGLLTIWAFMHYLSTWFLQFWIKEYEEKDDVKLFIGVSLALLFTTYLTIVARAFLLMIGCNDASRVVNSGMAFSVAHASICKFFDRVPIGRVLNRFSKDTQEVDQKLFINIDKLMVMGAGLILDLLVSVIVAGPFMIPLIVLFLWLGMRLRTYNMNLIRECTRLQGITASPIAHIFTEAISGTKIIRTYGCEQFMMQDYQKKLNENLKNLLLLTAAKQWFAQRIQMMSFFIILPAILLSIFVVNVSAGYFAILLVYLLSLGDNVKKLLNNITKTETRLVSFERCQFFMNIPAEEGYSNLRKLKQISARRHSISGPKISKSSSPTAWPQSGLLEFQNFSARYRAGLPFVLQNVSFTVPSGARLGILGRTGAGKTSLMSAIYSYFAEYDGDILYDGKKIRSIDLQRLRSSITIIPQEPVLFPGSLRKNLDPFSRFENEEILQALDEVQLSSKFTKEGLDFHVDGGGANISQGERQLICFARALLTETPLVLMDEATASVDPNTEATIRKLLEQRFKNRTVLMIAHKLQTVLSCDL